MVVRPIDANALHTIISAWPESIMYKDWVQSAIATAPTLTPPPAGGGGGHMTNADKIRAMSDEELAEFISRIEIGDFGPQVYGKTFCDLCSGQYECDNCRLWWLQQPAEEDT